MLYKIRGTLFYRFPRSGFHSAHPHPVPHFVLSGSLSSWQTRIRAPITTRLMDPHNDMASLMWHANERWKTDLVNVTIPVFFCVLMLPVPKSTIETRDDPSHKNSLYLKVILETITKSFNKQLVIYGCYRFWLLMALCAKKP